MIWLKFNTLDGVTVLDLGTVSLTLRVELVEGVEL